ncbi:hypothetical protein QE250_04185 [Chromatiaceae bacterium AAb-1]|nr:hypothetical protein [Chromatiaceae bacterium AAb-1]
MKFSSAQLQLLSRLNIEPLALYSDFVAEESGHIPATTVIDPDLNHPLAQDISLLLQELQPSFIWQLDIAADNCRLDGPVLFTPDLQQLQQPSVKKQLWQLLQQAVS